MASSGGLMSLDYLFGSDPEGGAGTLKGGESFYDFFDPGFLEMELDSATIERYMDITPPPLPPKETKKHSRSSDDDLTRSEAPSKRRKAPETDSIIRADYRSNARAYAIVKRKEVEFSALFDSISALESDLERIAALRTRCHSLLIITRDWNDWARGNDERIRQVLASKCSDAIKQLVGLGKWASGNDERIRQVLTSQCSDAIKQLVGLGKWASGNDERIRQVLASQCSDAIIQLVGLGEWARENDERIRQVLTSKCSDAIKQLVGLGEWASGNDERIRQVLASQCSDAIKQLVGVGEWARGNDKRIGQVLASTRPSAIELLTDNDLVHYFTDRDIPKSVRIPKDRLQRIKLLMATMPDPTSTEFIGPFGASAGIPGVHPVIPKLPETASKTAEV